MDTCCATELEIGFGARDVADDLAAYRRDGLGADQRRLLAALVADDVSGKTVLDIGGGIGAIHHDLLRAGARSVTDVDGYSAYIAAAQEEARRQGYLDRIAYHHGDFVELADVIEPADIVILLRVLCCYPNMPALVHASASKARGTYGLIYPRSTWWMRTRGSSIPGPAAPEMPDPGSRPCPPGVGHRCSRPKRGLQPHIRRLDLVLADPPLPSHGGSRPRDQPGRSRSSGPT